MSNFQKSQERLVTTKSLFIISLIVVFLTIISVWLLGLGQHRSLYVNSLLSTSILALAFFLYLSIGLYRGIKLKDDIGKIPINVKFDSIPDIFPSPDGNRSPSSHGTSSSSSGFSLDGFEMDGEGCLGIIVGILAWIAIFIIAVVAIYIFTTVFWAMILIFMAMLYWIFFRALRLVFKNANRCRGDLVASLRYAFIYTAMYTSWIYGIILTSHYLI